MRIERDTMGEMELPDDVLYGASTQRAIINFPISGWPLPPAFIRAFGLLKYACARANQELGRLDATKAEWIENAAREIFEGKLDSQFPVDVFQTGSGTSTNMNVNEVIANRVSQLTGNPIGSKNPVHPNDDVNLGQSSNDCTPSVLHLSAALALRDSLDPALATLEQALRSKADEFQSVVKIGRTHLMDATPLTLGQEFSGYTAQITKARRRISHAIEILGELAIGGTAVGTGINGHPEFAPRVIEILNRETGLKFREADNHFEAQAARDDCVEVAGILATIAAGLTKIANDIRWLGSGPRAGLGEIRLPATQPGSSIMPGKVNPVMSEMVVQVAAYVQGMAQTVTLCGRDGHFELNVTIPVIAKALLDSIELLSNASETFALRCVTGIEANAEHCEELVGRSLMLVTALNPHIGYENAAKLAKKAFEENRTLREVALESGMIDQTTLDQALDPMKMIRLER